VLLLGFASTSQAIG